MNSLPVVRLGAVLLFMASLGLGAATIRAIDDTQRRENDVSGAFVDYLLAERTLQLDLLNARAGLLRNYDPVNADLTSARSSLARLRKLRMGKRAKAILVGLMIKADRQEQLVEQFKSNNALLQNSLTRFAANDRADVRSTLSAAIFKLTLDTSPQAVGAAEAALRTAGQPTEGTAEAQLLSHARLLVAILPEIDTLLGSIRDMRMEPRMDVLRSVLTAEAEARSLGIQRLKLSLLVVVLLLLAAVITLFVAQRLTTNELRAQAANERLSAAIAMPLIETGRAKFRSRVEEAVGRLATHIGAKRLQLTIQGVPDSSHFSWPDADPEPEWLRKFASAAEVDRAWIGDAVIATRSRAGGHPVLDRKMRSGGVDTLVLLRTAEPHRVMIGIEPESPAFVQRRDLMVGVASAITVIAHGARREAMQVERERLERTLARARRMETIGAMASGIAHNFNNITAAIGGFAEIGQEHTRSGSAARYNFDEIRAAVTRSRDLVDDILTFAKQGRSPKRPINLLAVLTQAERLLRASARDRHAFHLSASGSRYPVVGAGSELQQVFLNICNNASYASDGRPVGIAVERRELTDHRHFSHGALDRARYVVVSVIDTGPGIQESIRRRLFEPFFTTKGGGTGLGLSTAWEIVQDHGGTIDVANLPEGGAQFSIWLPEMVADEAVPIVGDGARVLLLTEAEQLLAAEELLAEIGFEPLGFALTIDPEALRDTLENCDAVVIAAPDRRLVEVLVDRISPSLGERPLLLALPPGDTPIQAWPGRMLSYPLRADELSSLLFETWAAIAPSEAGEPPLSEPVRLQS